MCGCRALLAAISISMVGREHCAVRLARPVATRGYVGAN